MVLLTKVPGMRVLAPSSYQELQQMLHDALDVTEGPVAIRWPKTAARAVDPDEVGEGFAARRVRSGGDVCLVGVGKMLGPALDAAELLAADGIEATVWDPRCAHPLDEALLDDAASHPAVVTIEDGLLAGGIGSNLADALRERCAGKGPAVKVLGVPVAYVPQGKPDDILASLGLDAQGIATATRTLLT
jgi:1-deoxy-D-xylulose-5-phosphate synthase